VPRISFVLPHQVEDPQCRAWLDEAIAAGKPGPEYQAIRAHAPGVMRSFTESRRWVYHDGVLEFELKELVRAYVALSGECAYCSNQGVARELNADDERRRALLDYQRSGRYSEREKLAFRFADAIMWDPAEADDAMWAALGAEFTEAQIVELGYWIGFTFGGQRFLKTLGATQGQLQEALAEAQPGTAVGGPSSVSD
jgi:alkylhydroperoxidase family enzyme